MNFLQCMRVRFPALLYIALVFQAAVISIAAQTPQRHSLCYGLYAHYLSVDHRPAFNELPGFPKAEAPFSEGSGSGFSVGAVLDVPLGKLFPMDQFGSMVVVGLRGGVQLYDATLESREPTVFIVDGAPVNGAFGHTIIADFSSLTVEPFVAFAPFEALQFIVGPGFHFPLSAAFDQSEAVIEPAGVEHIEGGRALSLYRDRELPGLKSVQTAIMLGASYAVPLGKSIHLVPEVLHYTSLGGVSDEYEWGQSTFRFGVALKWKAAPAALRRHDTLRTRDTTEQSIAGIDTPRVRFVEAVTSTDSVVSEEEIHVTTRIRERWLREVPKPAPQLQVGLNARVVPKGARKAIEPAVLEVEEFISKQYTPLLNYVFFADSSARIPERYARLSLQESTGFKPEKLYELSPLDIYYNILNIVGARMRAWPETDISVTGCNADYEGEKGNTRLSERRAEVIKSYLADNWGIAPGRIRTVGRNLPAVPSNVRKAEGREENRRAEISASDPRILATVFAGDTVYSSTVGAVQFIPEVLSEAGIAEWKLSIRQSERLLKEFNGQGALPGLIEWQLSDSAVAVLGDAAIEYSLHVRDREQQTAFSVPGNIPLQVRTRNTSGESRSNGLREVERYSLLLFDFDSAELSGEHRKVIDFIRSRLSPDSRITVIGTTDGIGIEEYNEGLARQRAQAVARALGVEDALVEGAGEDTRSFPNDLPEGRFYSRTVIIEVEHSARK